ncbi:hypothetical protein IKE99_00660 [Candidatus Saccharibacteria bacterium]|nr:hypothetical protein [Candidatus Saccharibacteria bacterium]
MKKIVKDQVVIVKHILGETAVPLLEDLGNGKYRFRVDAWCEGEACKGGFFHLRQAIEAKPGKKVTNTVNRWPRLRAALHNAGVRPVNIPGGDYPLHYADQMAIADYSMSGAHYFIVKRADIGKYLDAFPLDEHGIKHREKIEEQKKAAEAEAYRQEHDPQCIAKRIGDALWYARCRCVLGNSEFNRISLIAKDGSEFSVIYPAIDTDLISGLDCYNVAKVVCSAPEETGLKYLDARRAGGIDPQQHYRIKKTYSAGWNRYTAYLMPLPGLATEVRQTCRWLRMFDTADNDGVNPSLIAEAERVILETFDLYDRLNKKRLVYEAATREVYVEYLHNNPQDWRDRSKFSETPEWSKEEPA